ncbi:hypothetical protein ACQY0O_003990 [Thecaphora frezii]
MPSLSARNLPPQAISSLTDTLSSTATTSADTAKAHLSTLTPVQLAFTVIGCIAATALVAYALWRCAKCMRRRSKNKHDDEEVGGLVAWR